MWKEGVAPRADELENKQHQLFFHRMQRNSLFQLFSVPFFLLTSSCCSSKGFRVLFELLEARACNLTLQSMDKDARVEETVDLLTNAELVRSVSDKHHDLLRPSARNYTRGQAKDGSGHGKGKHALLRDTEDFQMGIYDKPLPFFGCGVGWFSFLFGFLCPPMWFYATILYFGNHYRKDPRERAGLGASAIAALLCSVALLIIAVIHLLKLRSHYF